jgi:hypothetical protein
MAHQVGHNNFSAYKADFKKDTGKEWKDALLEYITYYNARMNDMNTQVNAAIIKEIAWAKENLSNSENLLTEIRDLLKKK